MKQDFTNREITHFFEEIKESLKNQDTVLFDLNKKVGETNGRVKALELWRMFILGGLGVMSMMVIPLIIYIYTNK